MNEYLKVLAHIKNNPITFKSNYARERASLIAEAASRGHLTCLNSSGLNCKCWCISTSGTKFLNKNGGCV